MHLLTSYRHVRFRSGALLALACATLGCGGNGADRAANSGGVVVSYFEWVQNLENQQWDLERVNARLEKKMRAAVDKTIDEWLLLGDRTDPRPADAPASPTLRDAALVTAIRRLGTVSLQRDIWM